MEGLQSQPFRSQTQNDNGKQQVRPQVGYVFGKQVCSDGVVVGHSEDWCDSGLESFNSGALSLDAPFLPENEPHSEWRLTNSGATICPTKAAHNDESADSCTSIGVGERLDSALGHSITDEMLGCISDGIGTMQLTEPSGNGSADSSGGVVGGQVKICHSEDVFSTLNFVSEDGDTALHLALIHEQLTFVMYLLDIISLDQNWTPYLDIQNDLGQTAMHLAVIVDQPHCLRALLLGGAGAEVQERGGNTALHLAVRESRMSCVRELTAAGLRRDHLRITNYSGVTSLHLAVQKGNEDMVRMLLDGGADVNQRDLGSGRSPLHWAVESQSPGLVRLLLQAGAAVNQASYAGHSPLYCARHRPSKEVQALLLEGGGTDMHDEEDEDEDERESEEDEFDDVIINGHRVL